MKTALEAMNYLKEQGVKSTRYRVGLLEVFFASSQPLAVQEILESFRKKDLEPNKTTVYRELYFLMEQGIVAEIDLGEEKKRYELAHLEHHHHLVCQSCQKIEDVVLEENLSDIESQIKRNNKFQVKEHMLEFYGLCHDCQ